MFKALNQFLITLFTAFNSIAHAILHMAKWGEETAGAFADEARIGRAAATAQLNRDLKIPAPVVPAIEA